MGTVSASAEGASRGVGGENSAVSRNFFQPFEELFEREARMGGRRASVSSDKRLKANRSAKYPYGQTFERQSDVEQGTPERWQHSRRAMELTERAGVKAARALEESVLDILVARRRITVAQREAALRFKLDFHRAGLEAHLCGSYNPVRTAFTPFGPWDERTEAQEAAYQRWRQAVRAVGKIHCDIVITVACYEIMPSPSRTENLAAGLDLLAKWYGIG